MQASHPQPRVMMLPAGHSVDNPYVELLERHLTARGVGVRPFSLVGLAARRVDVLHVHWPEWVRWLRFPPLTAIRLAALLTALAVARIRDIKVVWTAHNLRPHEPGRSGRWAYGAVTSNADAVIALSDTALAALHEEYPRLAGRPTAVIPHGHYRGAYPPPNEPAATRETLGLPRDAVIIGSFGRIRGYKGLPALCRALAASSRQDLRLLIGGKPDDPTTVAALREAIAGDPRIILEPRYLDDQELVDRAAASDLIVLPFTQVLNSGSALFALSMDRPVLLPRKGSLEELAESIGPGWARTYDGTITTTTLEDAADWALRRPSGGAPLERHDWARLAEATRDLYVAASGSDAVHEEGSPPPA